MSKLYKLIDWIQTIGNRSDILEWRQKAFDEVKKYDALVKAVDDHQNGKSQWKDVMAARRAIE